MVHRATPLCWRYTLPVYMGVRSVVGIVRRPILHWSFDGVDSSLPCTLCVSSWVGASLGALLALRLLGGGSNRA
uniref:Uncharacterized protein n=1 Tax=Picea glauca TaxID=3330 RepID=A0A101LYE3_PICGL|nr:hypothetical protein ABT39_MTgene5674 [Picea glauca]